jgi:hypothetical protein
MSDPTNRSGSGRNILKRSKPVPEVDRYRRILEDEYGVEVATLLFAAVWAEDRLRRGEGNGEAKAQQERTQFEETQFLVGAGLASTGVHELGITEGIPSADSVSKTVREGYTSSRKSNGTLRTPDPALVEDLTRFLRSSPYVLESPAFRLAIYSLTYQESQAARKALSAIGKALAGLARSSPARRFRKKLMDLDGRRYQVLRSASEGSGVPEKVIADFVSREAREEGREVTPGKIRMAASRIREKLGKRRLPYRERKGPAAHRS